MSWTPSRNTWFESTIRPRSPSLHVQDPLMDDMMAYLAVVTRCLKNHHPCPQGVPHINHPPHSTTPSPGTSEYERMQFIDDKSIFNIIVFLTLSFFLTSYSCSCCILDEASILAVINVQITIQIYIYIVYIM